MSVSGVLVEPAFRFSPPFEVSLGPEVADLAVLAGFGPDLEQRLVLDAVFGRAGGRSAAFEVGVVCARQNLKTGVFKQCALGWLFITGERLVVWSSHEFATAQEAFRDLEELVTGSDCLRREVKNVYRGNGDESIELLSGSRLVFKTRTRGGGRGLSGSKVILDEGFALRPMHMGALLPTLSAQPDPQVLYGSSAGLAESDVLRGVRDRGRAGGGGRLAWFEWCAPDPVVVCARGDGCDHRLGSVGCGCDDPVNWGLANPALGRRVSVEYVEAERRALPPAEFGRERMGWWDQPLDEVEVIPLGVWRGLVDERSEPVAPVAFAVVFAGDRSRAAVGVAGARADGLLHVEVADYRGGTDWVTGRVAELYQKHSPCAVVVDAAGHEGSLIPDLVAAGVRVVSPSGREVAQAFGQFYDAVVASGKLRHRGQDELVWALGGAATREIGDAGRAWARRRASADISPLVAVTSALWGFTARAGGGEPGAWLL